MISNSKYLNWEFIHSVLCPVANSASTNVPQFFFNPPFGVNERIVGIDINLPKPAVSEGYQLVDNTQLNRFTLNLINEKDFHVLKDYPCSQLTRIENFGRIRIFDLFADLKKSYVQNTVGTAVTAPGAILFTFYTVKK